MFLKCINKGTVIKGALFMPEFSSALRACNWWGITNLGGNGEWFIQWCYRIHWLLYILLVCVSAVVCLNIMTLNNNTVFELTATHHIHLVSQLLKQELSYVDASDLYTKPRNKQERAPYRTEVMKGISPRGTVY